MSKVSEKTFKMLKEEFEEKGTIMHKQYDRLFDELSFDDIIAIWNSVKKDCGMDNDIIYYTKDIHENNHEHRTGFEDLELLQELMYPYYLIKDGEPDYYNDNQLILSLGLVNDVYEWEYDVLTYIFNENIYVQI